MVNAGAPIVNANGAVVDTDALSVTLTVKLDGPVAVGVPAMVLPEIPSPAGSDPVAIDHV